MGRDPLFRRNLALSSGFMTYLESVHPEYQQLRREVEMSEATFVLLPSLKVDDCVREIVRRQLTSSFAAHLRLVEETELAYPIIRAADGAVMDGMHRVIKALVQGRETVDSVQFAADPAPDYVGRRPDELAYERPPDEPCT